MNAMKVNDRNVIDLSDYGRQVAVLIAKPLAYADVKAWQITVVHFFVMLFCCYFVYLNSLSSLAIAAILLEAKNILDAVDGSIARIQERPSKVGRFLDSNLDFLGHLLLFASIREVPFILKAIGFFSFVFQGTVFNYYFVLFRHYDGGDTTSKIEENWENEYPYDNPFMVKILFLFYLLFYKWQDVIVDFIEQNVLKCGRKKPDREFLAYVSIFGPGFQYLFVMLFFVAGKPSLIPLFFILPYNGLLLLAFLLRARCRKEVEK